MNETDAAMNPQSLEALRQSPGLSWKVWGTGSYQNWDTTLSLSTGDLTLLDRLLQGPCPEEVDERHYEYLRSRITRLILDEVELGHMPRLCAVI